jgi:hypothetical protein
MKFKEFAKNINKILKDFPESAEFDVVTSIDDEGNGFNAVYYDPGIGHYDSDQRDFIPEKQLEERKKINAVCLN